MKKGLIIGGASVLVIAIALLLIFCGGGEETSGVETIYIPDRIDYRYENGYIYRTGIAVYEEDWQNKETFTVTFTGDEETQKIIGYVIVFGDKTYTIDYIGSTKDEYICNEKGWIVFKAHRAPVEDGYSANEVVYTHDDRGRVVKINNTIWNRYSTTPTCRETDYTYTDTAEGSVGETPSNASEFMRKYDQFDRLVSEITFLDGKELNRMEYTYNEHGLVSAMTYYVEETFAYRIEVTYKAVEVSAQTAARLPEFVEQ